MMMRQLWLLMVIFSVFLGGCKAIPASDPLNGVWVNQKGDPEYLMIAIQEVENDLAGTQMAFAEKEQFDGYYRIEPTDKIFEISLQEEYADDDWEKGLMVQINECLYPYYPYDAEWRMVYFLLCHKPDVDQLVLRYAGEEVTSLERQK